MERKIYTFLKQLNRIILPSVGAVYYGLSLPFTLPREAGVLGVLIVISAITGIMVQIKARKYEPKILFQGELIISEQNDGKRIFSLELSRNPDEIAHMESITFKVVDSHDKQGL